jgi:hypothetical protein
MFLPTICRALRTAAAVKYGYIESFLECRLDLECARRLDIFEVDATERGFQRGYDLNQFFRVLFIDFNIEDIDIGKLLEQHALAFHHRLGGQRPNITQAQYCGSVADDSHQVTPGGYFADGCRVLVNQLACGSYPGGIRQ